MSALPPHDLRVVDDVMFLLTSSAEGLDHECVRRCKEIAQEPDRAWDVLALLTGVTRDSLRGCADGDRRRVIEALPAFRESFEAAAARAARHR